MEAGGLRAALEASLGAPGINVLGFRTGRARNVVLHHEAAATVQSALGELLVAAEVAP